MGSDSEAFCRFSRLSAQDMKKMPGVVNPKKSE
jgi:hypothetical protein